MDAKLSLLARIAAYLFAPIAFIALLPLVVLFVVGYYLFVIVQSVRTAIEVWRGRPDDTLPSLQRPHFLDMPIAAPIEKPADPERSVP